MANLTIPDISQPIVDLKTGRVDPEWYRKLRELIDTINEGL